MAAQDEKISMKSLRTLLESSKLQVASRRATGTIVLHDVLGYTLDGSEVTLRIEPNATHATESECAETTLKGWLSRVYIKDGSIILCFCRLPTRAREEAKHGTGYWRIVANVRIYGLILCPRKLTEEEKFKNLTNKFKEERKYRDGGVAWKRTYVQIKKIATPDELIALLEGELGYQSI